MPFEILDPKDGPTIGEPGDLAIEPLFIFYKNIDYRLEIAGGFELTLPTGSSDRGLGGELAVEPFLTAGIAVGPVDLLAEVAYEWVTQPDHEQEFSAGIAAGWHVTRRFTPFVELRTVTPTSGGDDHRTQVSVVPGFDFSPVAGLTAPRRADPPDLGQGSGLPGARRHRVGVLAGRASTCPIAWSTWLQPRHRSTNHG